MEWETPFDRLVAEARQRDERRIRTGRWWSTAKPTEEEASEQRQEMPPMPNPIR